MVNILRLFYYTNYVVSTLCSLVPTTHFTTVHCLSISFSLSPSLACRLFRDYPISPERHGLSGGERSVGAEKNKINKFTKTRSYRICSAGLCCAVLFMFPIGVFAFGGGCLGCPHGVLPLVPLPLPRDKATEKFFFVTTELWQG